MNELTLRDWLVSPAAGRLTHDAFLEGLADRLRQAGVPLDRASASVQTRHPEVYVHAGIWTLEDGASVHARPRTLAETGRYLESPVIVVQRTLQSLRVDLRQEHPPYPVCRELKDEGYTDYLIQPLESAWGDASFASWSTRAPGGFEPEHIELLEALRSTLSLRLSEASQVLAMGHLLRTYLGPNAAKRVLDGEFLRGSGERIQAAVWFCDLRGFTSFTDRAPLESVIPMLDRYFETVAGPVAAEGGEVLKLIGDAMLAVFPGSPDATCAAALRAARRALATHTPELEASGLTFGIGLHVGEVVYGNVGAADRLDFTVIGPTVNEASRVEGLCKTLGQRLLITDAFAQHVDGHELRSLGEHALRGASRPRELFTLARVG